MQCVKSVYLILVYFVFFFKNSVNSANILIVAPFPTYSHFAIPLRLSKELVNRGHQVTCITPFPQKTKIKNYEEILVVENIHYLENDRKELMLRSDFSLLKDLTSFFDLTSRTSMHTLENKNVQALLKSNRTFDLVIAEAFLTEPFVGFGHHYKAPVILISAMSSCTVNNFIMGNVEPSSYIPHIGSTLSNPMNFWQRLENFLRIKLFQAILHFYHLPIQRKTFKTFIKDVELDDVLYNTSLLFTNSHPSFSSAVPLNPNIIEIGGLHVAQAKPLSEDLKKFLDNATEGVVLFSLGSNLKSEELRPEIKAIFLKSFSKLKQKVLWKFEIDLPDAPKNVKIMKWLPQQDVMTHPNVKVFLTHGGRFSMVETVYHGLPIIGIPVFGDQHYNILQAVNDGYGLKVDLRTLTEEALSSALNEILNNPKYSKNAKYRSSLLHSQPIKPLDKAIFWIEHVIHFKGALNLRSPSLNLSWYEKEMIDVIVFIAIITVVFLFMIYVIIKTLCSCLGHKNSKKDVKSKKA